MQGITRWARSLWASSNIPPVGGRHTGAGVEVVRACSPHHVLGPGSVYGDGLDVARSVVADTCEGCIANFPSKARQMRPKAAQDREWLTEQKWHLWRAPRESS